MLEFKRLDPKPDFPDVHSVQDAKAFVHYCLMQGQPLKALTAVAYFVQQELPETSPESCPLLPREFEEDADITGVLATARHLGKKQGNGLGAVRDCLGILYSRAPALIEDLIPQAENIVGDRYLVH